MVVPLSPRFRDGVYKSLEEVKSLFLIDSSESVQYEGVYRAFVNDNIIWRFSNLGVFYLSEYLNDDVLPHIKKAINNIITTRQDSASYTIYSFITSTDFIWVAQNSGTTAGSTPFSGSYNIGDTVVDGTITWEAQLAHYGSHNFFWSESDDVLDTLQASVNQDSTAASVFMMVEKYIDVTGDFLWLEDTSNIAGTSYIDLIYNAYLNNISNQIDADNLCFVFQNEISPIDGSANSFKFCINNGEDIGGLKSLVNIFTILSDLTRRTAVEVDIAKLIIGINSLYDATFKLFLWNNTASPTETDSSTQIPRWLAQFAPLLYTTDSEVVVQRRLDAYNHALKVIPDWWKREDFNPALSFFAIYYDATIGGNYLHVTEHVDYIEQTYLQTRFLEFLDTAILVRNKFFLLGNHGVTVNLFDKPVDFMKIVSIDDTDSPYTVLNTTEFIYANCTNGDIDINLYSYVGNEENELIIKKDDNSNNEVTVTPDGSETIDGFTDLKLKKKRRPSARLIAASTSFSSGWKLIGESET